MQKGDECGVKFGKDHPKIRARLAFMRRRRKLAQWLMKIVNWLDDDFLQATCIGDKIEIDVLKYVPPDKKWHHCAATVEYWFRQDSPGVKKEEFYLDGVRISNILREIKKEDCPE